MRFLTQLGQGMMAINNTELFYNFQGLTSDGKYYLAAGLPVSHPELPAGPEASGQPAMEPKDFADYVSETVTLLNQQPAGSFTPDLNELDALTGSIEAK